MNTLSARRELAFVCALAVLGLGLVLIVAFAPWYGPTSSGGARPAVVEPTPQPAEVRVEFISHR
ncbi:hypothetical protein [Actinoplanes sp. NPDC051859]|uniref:hypothetical protein n=1 Tax=Actinoplanes sp. NPDC051859 TaxID=3363909 RepID=UPI0037939DF3